MKNDGRKERWQMDLRLFRINVKQKKTDIQFLSREVAEKQRSFTKAFQDIAEPHWLV